MTVPANSLSLLRHPLRALSNVLLDLRRALLLMWVLLKTALPIGLRRLFWIHDDPAAIGDRLRRSLQSLGITYVKFGQFMAMRFDILPEEICRELARLFDDVAPMHPSEVRRILELEFRSPVEQVFRDFDWQCIAAASVAQVHRATTFDGDAVAVKIQRPDIRRIFAADIRNFRRAARIGDYLQLLGLQSLVQGIDEFENYTLREMDFVTEGRTAERLRRNATEHDTAPRIYWNLTTTRVLTMEFIDGHKLSDVIHLIETGRSDELKKIAPGLNFKEVLDNFSRACMKQLFVTGFFHADPHPGNIFLREDGTVVFVDFGIFGHLTDERRETFASYIENVAIGNIEASYRHFIKLLQLTPQTDMQQLRRDIHHIMRGWHEASLRQDAALSERHLGTYFGEFISAIRQNNVVMSMDTILFWRAILALDSTALRFGGDYDLLNALRQFFEEVRPSPIERVISLLSDRQWANTLLTVPRESPQQIDRLMSDLVQGSTPLPVLCSSIQGAGYPRNAEVRVLVLPMVMAALFILVTRLSLGVIGQGVLWIAILLLAAALVAGLVRK